MADPAQGVTLGEITGQARRRLREAGIETADLDARLIVQDLTGTSATDAIVRPGEGISPEAADAVRHAVARRVGGEPVHRILGWREFHGLRLTLSPGTLEPRPDTECLVEALVPIAGDFMRGRQACRILDLGTGTGAIALALLASVPGSVASGSDISPDALATALRNAHINGLSERFDVIRSDWFTGIEGVFHIIVSNPPYIPSQSIAALAREVRDHDPVAALDGGPDGLDCYRSIARSARRYLVDEGVVGVEFGFDQRDEVISIFAAAGFRLREAGKDLSGHWRAAIFH